MKSVVFLFILFFALPVYADTPLYDNDAVLLGLNAIQRSDPTNALTFFLKAAEAGDTVGQYNLGKLYFDGLGTKKDLNAAFKWFEKAADQGDSNSLTFIGIMYLNGEGVARDEQRGLSILKRRAAAGDERAEKVLATYEENRRNQELAEKMRVAEAEKKSRPRSITARIGDVLDTDLNLSDEEAKAIIRKTYPKCANVQFSGPIAGSYREMHVFAQMNREMVNGKDKQVIYREIETALNRGLTCRRDVTNFMGCQGFSFSDLTYGEVPSPALPNYKKYGQSHADYVEVYSMQTFKSGRQELVPIFVEKKNVRCVGSNNDPGVYSGKPLKFP